MPSKISGIKKLDKEFSFFKKTILPEKILPKKNWFKKFEKYWSPSEKEAQKNLQKLIKDKITDYGETRDFPHIDGTSKL